MEADLRGLLQDRAFAKSFGGFCAKIRRNNGLTQKELGNACQLTFKSISNFERGEQTPQPPALLCLIQKLNFNDVAAALRAFEADNGQISTRLLGDARGVDVFEGEQLYSKIVEDIRVADRESGEKSLYVSRLHGIEMEKSPPVGGKANKDFEKALRNCVLSESWHTNIIYHIPNPGQHKLEELLDHLKSMDRELSGRMKTDFVVKVVCFIRAPYVLPPLVVEGENLKSAYLGIQREHTYGVRKAMRLTGEGPLAFAKVYWNQLWDDPRARYIRVRGRISSEGIEDVKQQIKQRDAWQRMSRDR